MGSADHESESAPSRISSRRTSIFAGAILIVVIIMGASDFEFHSSAFPVNPSSSHAVSFSSSVSPLGLKLSVALNATAIRRYGTLGVQIEVLNTLDHNVSIALGPVNANISAWNRYDFFCGVNIAGSLLGFGLFKGDYSPANISQAGSPLQLAPFVRTTCSIFAYPQEIVFKPMSNQLATTNGPRKTVALNVTSEQCVAVSQAFHKCGPALGLFGYWNTQSFLSLDGATFQSPYFQYFPPGAYTLVAADAWGQTIYVHFDVL